jgi:glycosyltransferase involved in cell wall biosynthesis
MEFAGGIGRFVANLTDEFRGRALPFRIRFIDTRGSRHIALSPIFFALALARILVLGVAGRLSVIHANVATHGSVLRKFVVVALASILDVPIILHLHAAIFERFYASLPTILQARVRWMFRRSRRVVVLGSQAGQFVTDCLGVPPDRIEVIANGVPRPAALTAGANRGTAAASIVFLGQLGERKGVDSLLAALASPIVARHAWRATLAGDGDAMPFRLQARQLGLADRVDFPGWLEPARVANLLEQASILALPSRAEGLPMAVLEALAHSVPVITTPVGAVPEFLRDGQSVLFVNPGDVAALAAALDRLITDTELRVRLGRGGHSVFLRDFDIAIVADRFAAIYSRLASERGAVRYARDRAARYAS